MIFTISDTEYMPNSAPWVNVRDSEGEVVAQWLLTNPYTGPSLAHNDHDDWVHYPDGALKIRYAAKDPHGSLYGVRYTIPAQLLQHRDALQAYVSERVAEFIANRDSYLIDQTRFQYHQGK